MDAGMNHGNKRNQQLRATPAYPRGPNPQQKTSLRMCVPGPQEGERKEEKCFYMYFSISRSAEETKDEREVHTPPPARVSL